MRRRCRAAIWFVIVAGASIPLALRIIRGVRELPLRIGVGVYMAVISLMVASAIASGDRSPRPAPCSSSSPMR